MQLAPHQVKPHTHTIVLAWLLLTSFKVVMGLHVLTDPQVSLEYKLSYLLHVPLDAGIILYLLSRMWAPYQATKTGTYPRVWSWLWRGIVSGFVRLAILAPVAYLAFPLKPVTEQSALYVLSMLLPNALAAVIAIWLLFSPRKVEKIQSFARWVRRRAAKTDA